MNLVCDCENELEILLITRPEFKHAQTSMFYGYVFLKERHFVVLSNV